MPSWDDPEMRVFARLIHEDDQHALYLMFNAGSLGIGYHLETSITKHCFKAALLAKATQRVLKLLRRQRACQS